MSYIDGTQLRTYISAGGTDTFGTSVVSAAVVTEAIADAEAIIDMRLAKRYSTPFSGSIPPGIVSISKMMSGWRVLRSVYGDEIPDAAKFVKDDYDRAEKYLTFLANGSMDLPSGTASSGAVVSLKGSNRYYGSNKDYPPIFDMDDSLNQAVDTDRLSDIASARE